jgi:hypothetical protein
MANTLTNLIPVLYEGMDIVARELVGFIPSVDIDAKADAAAVGQTISTPVTPAGVLEDINPGQLPADSGDQTIGTLNMSITKSKASPIRWSGEEMKGYLTNGTYQTTLAQQFAQSMRALTNAVETDLAALYAASSRAYGTAGTAPFATDLSDAANVLKILKDNGAPCADLQMVINTTAGAKFRSMGQLTKANEAGTPDVRSQGILLDVHGFKIRESAKVASVTKGTGTLYTSSAAGFAVGTTSIPVITGSGTIVAGDVITFAGDTNKYVVATGVAAPGTIVIQNPGLLQALPASATALTIGNSFTANMAFERSAIKLLARTPAMPEGGDDADDVYNLTDPISGLTFQVAVYKLYRRVKFEVGLAWGVATTKKEFTGILLG